MGVRKSGRSPDLLCQLSVKDSVLVSRNAVGFIAEFDDGISKHTTHLTCKVVTVLTSAMIHGIAVFRGRYCIAVQFQDLIRPICKRLEVDVLDCSS